MWLIPFTFTLAYTVVLGVMLTILVWKVRVDVSGMMRSVYIIDIQSAPEREELARDAKMRFNFKSAKMNCRETYKNDLTNQHFRAWSNDLGYGFCRTN